MGRGAESTVPRLRWFRLVVAELLVYAAAASGWAAFQLAKGETSRDALEAGLVWPLPLVLVNLGLFLYRRRQRYRPNPYHLTREERQAALDAMSPDHPIPTDPRIRDEALRLARDIQQEDGTGGRAVVVVFLVTVVGLGIAGVVSSHWFLVPAALFLLLGLVTVPVERGRRARLAELRRWDQASRTRL